MTKNNNILLFYIFVIVLKILFLLIPLFFDRHLNLDDLLFFVIIYIITFFLVKSRACIFKEELEIQEKILINVEQKSLLFFVSIFVMGLLDLAALSAPIYNNLGELIGEDTALQKTVSFENVVTVKSIPRIVELDANKYSLITEENDILKTLESYPISRSGRQSVFHYSKEVENDLNAKSKILVKSILQVSEHHLLPSYDVSAKAWIRNDIDNLSHNLAIFEQNLNTLRLIYDDRYYYHLNLSIKDLASKNVNLSENAQRAVEQEAICSNRNFRNSLNLKIYDYEQVKDSVFTCLSSLKDLDENLNAPIQSFSNKERTALCLLEMSSKDMEIENLRNLIILEDDDFKITNYLEKIELLKSEKFELMTKLCDDDTPCSSLVSSINNTPVGRGTPLSSNQISFSWPK